MTAASFEAAKAGPELQRQEAVRLAREAYTAARSEQLATWATAKAAVSARLEKAKGDLPTDPKAAAAAQVEYTAANAAMIAVEQSPSERPLLAVMDAAINAANHDYHSAVRALAPLHGVRSEG
jgi:hypothetical protein